MRKPPLFSGNLKFHSRIRFELRPRARPLCPQIAAPDARPHPRDGHPASPPSRLVSDRFPGAGHRDRYPVPFHRPGSQRTDTADRRAAPDRSAKAFLDTSGTCPVAGRVLENWTPTVGARDPDAAALQGARDHDWPNRPNCSATPPRSCIAGFGRRWGGIVDRPGRSATVRRSATWQDCRPTAAEATLHRCRRRPAPTGAARSSNSWPSSPGGHGRAPNWPPSSGSTTSTASASNCPNGHTKATSTRSAQLSTDPHLSKGTPLRQQIASAGHRAGEGLPSSRRHHRCVPRPIRRGVLDGCASRIYTASMAFAPISRGSALPRPTHRAG